MRSRRGGGGERRSAPRGGRSGGSSVGSGRGGGGGAATGAPGLASMQDGCGGVGTRRSECGRCGIGKGRWVWSWRGGVTWRKWRTWRGGGGEEEGEVGRCCGVEGSRRWESERQCRLQHGKTGALHQVCQPRFVFLLAMRLWLAVYLCTPPRMSRKAHSLRSRGWRIPSAVAGGAGAFAAVAG